VRLSQPTALATDSAGNIYFADGGNHVIRRVTPDGEVSTQHGWRAALDIPPRTLCVGCNFTAPWTLAVADGGKVFVGGGNSTLLQATAAGVVTILAGLAGGSGNSDGIGEAARFGGYTYGEFGQQYQPAGLHGVTLDSAGTAYVSDPLNSAIRKITKEAEVTTLIASVPTSIRQATPIGPSRRSGDKQVF
jgi:hypothetical protein